MKRLIFLLGLLGLLILPAGAALAAPHFDGTVVAAGETVNEDISLFGQELTIEAGSTVNGDVTIVGGNAEIAGTINGDIAVLGGNVSLNGPVRGDLAVFGGNLDIESDTRLDGSCFAVGGHVNNLSGGAVRCSQSGGLPALPLINGMVQRGDGADAPATARAGAFVRDAIGLVGWSLFLGGLAWAVSTVWPRPLARTREALRARPLTSGVVGLLTAAAFASLATILALLSTLLVIVCIGLLGYPLLLAMTALFAMAAAYGWVAVGSVLGERLLRSAQLKGRREVNAAIVGTVALTFGLGLLMQLPAIFVVPVLAGLAAFVLFSAGLGAATLTQLGRRAYPAGALDAGKVEDVLITLPEP